MWEGGGHVNLYGGIILIYINVNEFYYVYIKVYE